MANQGIETLTAEKFRPFGRVIGYPGKGAKGRKRNLFRIVVRDPRARGWRIAYLIVRDRMIRRMEQHPGSWESFEPVRGRGLLFVSSRRDTRCIRCFRLERPVVLRKGVWHGVVTAALEAEIKLTENNKVRCVYWNLPFKLDTRGRRCPLGPAAVVKK